MLSPGFVNHDGNSLAKIQAVGVWLQLNPLLNIFDPNSMDFAERFHFKTNDVSVVRKIM